MGKTPPAEISESQLIDRFFASHRNKRKDVRVGIGDDAALLEVPVDKSLVATVDTLLAGVHFPESTSPEDIGYRALAVNLSDLAAMGAEPTWVTLALSLPYADPDWVEAFARGFLSLADEFNVALVGGDTVRGPLQVSVQAHGLVSKNKGLRRDTAAAGDAIYVTGTLGDAAAGLSLVETAGEAASAETQQLLRRFYHPTPRVLEGQALLHVASACIDVSDGLLLDVSRLATASGVGAELFVEQLPLSQSLLCFEHVRAREFALSGGDDYELCFAIPPAHEQQLWALTRDWPDGCKRIGVLTDTESVRCRLNGRPYLPTRDGYRHF